MKDLSKSYWELSYSKEADVIILGGGIVGINTAIHLKSSQPNTEVLVIDQQWLGGGASVKNAGFVCFGSPTELLDDIENYGEDFAVEVFQKRWLGAQKLVKNIPSAVLELDKCGGMEIFDNQSNVSNDQVDRLNSLVEKSIGLANHFRKAPQTFLPTFSPIGIKMEAESSINPMKMMAFLYKKAITLGVKFYLETVASIDDENKSLTLTNHQTIKYEKLAITLNGYVSRLMPNLGVRPARNLVLITEDLPDISWKNVIHYDKGYVYFRRIGHKILIGGGRNIDKDNEYTDELGINPKINDFLESFLFEKVLNGRKVEIIHKYQGILGFGEDKFPKAQWYNENIAYACGMGGMGVAIGTQIGEDLAQLITLKKYII
jgi:gamma-glutamylputrescine oxidase